MITLYLYNNQNIYTHSVEVDENGVVPSNSSVIEPPAIESGKVAFWVNDQWVIIDEPTPIVPAVEIPQSITMRQAKLALLENQLLETVETAIVAMGSPAMVIEWEYSTVFERSNPLLNTLCDALGMSKEDIDQLFIHANSL